MISFTFTLIAKDYFGLQTFIPSQTKRNKKEPIALNFRGEESFFCFLTETVITNDSSEASSSILDRELLSIAVVGGGFLGAEEWMVH